MTSNTLPERTPAENLLMRARAAEQRVYELEAENARLVKSNRELDATLWFVGAVMEDKGGAVAALLTNKERVVTRMILKEMRNRPIAEALGQSEQIVRNYVRVILAKTRCTTRFQLCMLALKSPTFLAELQQPKRKKHER